MKLYLNKKNTIITVCAASMISFFSCTKNFQKYNTDNTGIADEDLSIPSLVGSFETGLLSNYQRAQNLGADTYAGYMSSGTDFGTQTNWNYTMRDDWNSTAFNDQYTKISGPIVNKFAGMARDEYPDIYAVALIIKVLAMDRVTDKFGPIAYTKIGTVLNNTPFDSQQDVYNAFFTDLDTAVNNLTAYIKDNSGNKPLSGYDYIYNGDYTEWLKFANSLRLRLALHLTKIDPSTAETQVKKALANTGGLLESTSDDAAISQSGGRENDIYQITHDWSNNNIGAPIACYLTGYKDPRLTKYMMPATSPAESASGKYIGIRIGTPLSTVAATIYPAYGRPNTDSANALMAFSSPQYVMTAAEVWFLRAEAALRGWSAESVQTDYETGIKTSMTQWDATIGNYLSDDTSTEAPYVDPAQPKYNDDTTSTITVAWSSSDTKEKQLERIITQKWIAMFPEGHEAWTEFRRTGYPKLFTVAQNTNPSQVSTSIQIRRLNYPSNEYTAENDAITEAVKLLGGADNPGTRLWWDVDKSNF